MLYTAITKKKKKVYIIGDDISSLNTHSVISRNTRLNNRLRNFKNIKYYILYILYITNNAKFVSMC